MSLDIKLFSHDLYPPGRILTAVVVVGWGLGGVVKMLVIS